MRFKKWTAIATAAIMIFSINLPVFAENNVPKDAVVAESSVSISVDVSGSTETSSGDCYITMGTQSIKYMLSNPYPDKMYADLLKVTVPGYITSGNGSTIVTFTKEGAVIADEKAPTNCSLRFAVDYEDVKGITFSTTDAKVRKATLADVLSEGTIGFVAKDQQHGDDLVKPGSSIYFPIAKEYSDEDRFELTVKKGSGSKNIKSVKVVEKKLETLIATDGSREYAPPAARAHYIEVKLKPDKKEAEYKASFSISLKSKIQQTVGEVYYPIGAVIAQEDVGAAWVETAMLEGSSMQMKLGTDGVVVKPVKNEENEVVWEDNDKEVVKLSFTADSEPMPYLPKLSTVWGEQEYEKQFQNVDAYKFEFARNPAISASSRATLTIYNPFTNPADAYRMDDAYAVAAADIIVYEVIDGEAVDITDRVQAITDNNGRQALALRTRTLGTYIITPRVEGVSKPLVKKEILSAQAQKANPQTGG